jgi:glycosyltransferase involved in cell wall biosynthesis
MIKVSVVVPVYNAGPYLERCSPSLLNQSMPRSEYEVIFVDDGSTDDSALRLEELAAANPHMRWMTQPNSGWPGKPRNVGIAMARGEYIQFVDQDDQLGYEALERLYALGSRNRADIVLGKMAGGMAGPNVAFRRTVQCGSVADFPAIESMTGHKMFRTEFLHEHAIRFPEGYWRMEDLLFVARAYAKARRISVVADYPCYYWNRWDDKVNSSLVAYDLAENYQRLRVVIAALRDGTEPGELQNYLLRRFYRVETLGLSTDPEVFPLARRVALEAFPPGVRDGLPAIQRLRAELLEHGFYDGLVECVRRERDLKPEITVTRMVIDPEGVIRCSMRFRLLRPGRQPLTIRAVEDGFLLDPEFVRDLPAPDLAIADPLGYAHGDLQLYDSDRQVWWYPEASLRPRLSPISDDRAEVVVDGDVSIDPSLAADGHPLAPGTYVVWFDGQVLGSGRRRRLVVPNVIRPRQVWTLSADGSVAVMTRTSADGRLLLQVEDGSAWLAEHIHRRSSSSFVSRSLELPIRLDGNGPSRSITVGLATFDGALINATLSAGPQGAALTIPRTSELGSGVYVLRPLLGSAPIAKIRVRWGRVRWVADARYPGRAKQLDRAIRRSPLLRNHRLRRVLAKIRAVGSANFAGLSGKAQTTQKSR